MKDRPPLVRHIFVIVDWLFMNVSKAFSKKISKNSCRYEKVGIQLLECLSKNFHGAVDRFGWKIDDYVKNGGPGGLTYM